jgi:hypothetical protein
MLRAELMSCAGIDQQKSGSESDLGRSAVMEGEWNAKAPAFQGRGF